MSEDLQSPVPAPDSGAPAPKISRAIYGMPMFATMLASDMAATVSWYVDGLGFIELFSMPGPSGPVLVHLRRWQFQDVLVRRALRAVVPGTSCTMTFAAVHEEIDALAERAGAHGGGVVDALLDTPWNTRDLSTTDPDGNVVIFSAARPRDQADAGFSEQVQRWNTEQRASGP